MYYYNVNEIVKDFTTYSIVVDENNKLIKYSDGYYGTAKLIDMSKQHEECQIIKVEYNDIKSMLDNCNHMKMINNQIVFEIRQKYSVDDEMKLIKKALINPLDEEYLEMQKYIDNIKSIYNVTKKEMGLIE